jgi:hypothetical protein
MNVVDPVSFDRLVDAIDAVAHHPWWELWVSLGLALGTLATFGATAFMAWKTAALASETLDASIVADLHHQESQSGVLVWVHDSRTLTIFPSLMRMQGRIQNVGFGAALDVEVAVLNPEGPGPSPIVLFSISSMSTQDSRPITTSSSPNMDMYYDGEQLLEIAALEQILLQIRYTTMFGISRTTTYRSNERVITRDSTSFQFRNEVIDLKRDPRLRAVTQRPLGRSKKLGPSTISG